MDYPKSHINSLTKPIPLYQRVGYLYELLLEINDTIESILSEDTRFDKASFPWVESWTIKELDEHIEEINSIIRQLIVGEMITPIDTRGDLLETETQVLEAKLSALHIIKSNKNLFEFKYYMISVRERLIAESRNQPQ